MRLRKLESEYRNTNSNSREILFLEVFGISSKKKKKDCYNKPQYDRENKMLHVNVQILIENQLTSYSYVLNDCKRLKSNVAN